MIKLTKISNHQSPMMMNSFQRRLKRLGLDDVLMIISFYDGHAWMLSSHNAIPVKQVNLSQEMQEGTVSHPKETNVSRIPTYQRLSEAAIAAAGMINVFSIYRRCIECEFYFLGLQQLGSERYPSSSLKAFEQCCFDFVIQKKPQLYLLNPLYRKSFILNYPNCLANVIQQESKIPRRLTHREQECLFYTLGGKGTSDIAMALGVSPRVIQLHYRHIIEKLSCSNLTEAAFIALMLGEVGCLTHFKL